MNYKKIYDSIIESRRVNVLTHDKDNYSEEHHILPASLGGSDYKDNLVRVTGREHFILHALLVRVFERFNKNFYNKMVYAFNNMRCNNDNHERYFNSRLFEKYRIVHSKLVSERMKIDQMGDKNSQFGTIWITNESLKENKKILNDELIPDGWIKGRFNYNKLNENIIKYSKLLELYNKSELSWDSFREENKVKGTSYNFKMQCWKYLGKDIFIEEKVVIRKPRKPRKKKVNVEKVELLSKKIIKLTNWYKIYSEHGFEKFVELTGYDKSKPNLVHQLKKYVKEFKPQNGKKRG